MIFTSHIVFLIYMQCPYCMRRFRDDVAARHIPKCKNTINRPKPPPGVAAVSRRTPASQMTPTRSTQPPTRTSGIYNSIQQQQPAAAPQRSTPSSRAPSASMLARPSPAATRAPAQTAATRQSTVARQAPAMSQQRRPSSAAKFCTNCGTGFFSEAQRFCGECGSIRM